MIREEDSLGRNAGVAGDNLEGMTEEAAWFLAWVSWRTVAELSGDHEGMALWGDYELILGKTFFMAVEKLLSLLKLHFPGIKL